MDVGEKVPTFIAFCELFLGDVKVEYFVNLWHFWWLLGFASHLLIHWHQFFENLKGVKVVHISCKFHLHLTCSCRAFIFQMFSYQQKVQFEAASWWFFGCNTPKCGQIRLKFWPVMQCQVMHQTCEGLYFILKKLTVVKYEHIPKFVSSNNCFEISVIYHKKF